MNPFSSEYFDAQLAKYQDLVPAEQGDVRLEFTNPKGVLDGYMYKDFVDINKVPTLFIGDTLWMSLTPMEIQSHFLPIKLARGKVGVAGLGLGYYVQEILNKREVKEVIVYEINKDVIAMYVNTFGYNPKLKIVNKDIFEVENEFFDFFYCDIYPCMFDREALLHKDAICNKNSIMEYFFWTMEAFMLYDTAIHPNKHREYSVANKRAFGELMVNFLNSDKFKKMYSIEEFNMIFG